MQGIVHRTEVASREVGIQIYVGLHSLARTLGERARDERGQTAAEYMGMILVIATIIVALVTADLGKQISDLAKKLIDSVASGKKTP